MMKLEKLERTLCIIWFLSYCAHLFLNLLSLHIAIPESDYVLDGKNKIGVKKGKMEWVLSAP